MNKQSLYMTLLLLLSLSAICHAQRSTRHFVVKLEQNTGSPDKSFSIQQHYQNTLPNNPSIIAKINNYEESDAPANNIPPGPGCYGLKTGIIESISWNLLYASHLLVAYELTLTSKDAYLNSNIYSWLPFIVVGSLLNSYWNPDSLMFNTIGQQELSQDYPFLINTMTLSSEDNQQQGQLSASSGQQASGTTTRVTGSFTSSLDSCSGEGNGDPEQHQHTYGLDCYVDSCNGVCRFRPPPDSQELAEAGENCPICFDKFSKAMVTPCCSQKIDTHCLRRVFLNAPRWSTKTCPFCRADMNFLARSPDLALSVETQQDLPAHYNEPPGIRSSRTAFIALTERAFGPRTSNEAEIGGDGQQRRCGRVCKNAEALSYYKSKYHTGQKACELSVISRDGQSRPCLKVCKNVQALAYHKVKCHSRQKTRDVTDVGKDGQQRPREKVCRKTRAPVEHKREHRNR